MVRGCNGDAIAVAGDPSEIAVISRGLCAFTTKVTNATAAGYAAAIVMNDAARCEASVSMLVVGTIPAFFVPRPSGLEILGRTQDGGCDDSTLTEGDTGQVATAGAVFDGWGYFHVINNDPAGVTVPGTLTTKAGSTTVGYLGHIGYYAPEEAAYPTKAFGFGDLTMHNVEVDPLNRNQSYVSWYSAGMRALEYRPGHFRSNANGEGSYSWNVHEVGRWIDPQGSNFWGVTVTNIGGQQYILASDRNTGLHIFTWECEGRQSGNNALYCDPTFNQP